jgi:hypothetical protein
MLYIGVECVAGNCVTAPALSSTIHSQMRSAMYIAFTACSDVPSLGTHLDAARSFALRFPDGHELRIFDDPDRYESFSIQPGDIFI